MYACICIWLMGMMTLICLWRPGRLDDYYYTTRTAVPASIINRPFHFWIPLHASNPSPTLKLSLSFVGLFTMHVFVGYQCLLARWPGFLIIFWLADPGQINVGAASSHWPFGWSFCLFFAWLSNLATVVLLLAAGGGEELLFRVCCGESADDDVIVCSSSF